MKQKFLLLLLICLSICTSAFCQYVSVQSVNGQNPNTVINAHLSGDGVYISNGMFNNSAGNITYPQLGTFSYTGTGFPFHSGLVMTTGNVSVAAGPNNTGSASGAVTPYYTDTQLQTVNSAVTSCAALDFDFVAYSDTFAFSYVFGSEEYEEYVGSSYNDVFAFFLTGLDPVTYATTTRNVALIPNTVLPVTINNLNHQSHTNYYIHNTNSCVQYDGYTTRLTAQASILACQTYHMHLAIGNVSDGAYDSGVFLEEGSFYSPSSELNKDYNMDTTGVEFGDTLIQNCREVDIRFQMPRPVATGNYHADITFEGDAIVGEDYMLTNNGHELDMINNSIFYQQGTDAQIIHMSVLPNATFEDNQVKLARLIITTIFCDDYWYAGRVDAGRIDTLEFYLKGNDTIVLSDTMLAACHQCDLVTALKVRGADNLVYQWIPAIDITNPNEITSPATITSNRTYQIVAKDPYGCLADTANVEITIHEKPEADVHISPDKGCMPLSVSVLTSNAPEECDIRWNITNETGYDTTFTINPMYVTFDSAGYYNVSVWMSTAPGCADSNRINNAIRVSDFPHADFELSPTEADNGEIVYFYNHSQGIPPLYYSWNFGDGSSSNEEEPTHHYHVNSSEIMTVRLSVSNEDGCSDDTSAVVTVVDNFALYVPNAFTPNGDNNNDVFLPRVNDVAYYCLEIYDRDGNLFFKTEDPEMPWDGTINGKLALTGTYNWVIRYVRYSNLNKTLMRKGSVTLLR